MKKDFYALFFPVLIASFLGLARGAAAYEVPCYCRYDNSHPDFQSPNAGPDAPKYCSNEVYFSGMVTGNTGPAVAAACGDRCVTTGSRFVAVTSVDPNEWANYGNPVNLVTAETDQCVFTPFQTLPNPPDHWEPEYASCFQPLNARAGSNTWPQACSFCFCKFKEGPGQIPTCIGKTTLVKATSYPAKCESLCQALNLDAMGRASKSPDDHCQFVTRNSCSQPLNPNGSGCKEDLEALGEARAAAEFQASRGSVIGQFLPLGDITLPEFIGRLIKQILGVVGALALVFFIWGGIKYMTAAGDDKKTKEGRDMIVAAVSGLAAIFLSYALLSLLINALT